MIEQRSGSFGISENKVAKAYHRSLLRSVKPYEVSALIPYQRNRSAT